jgi:hypothetical protein
MADTNNSSRSLLKATYVPLNVSSANVASTQAAAVAPQPNVMMKAAYLRGLNIRPGEMAALHKSPKMKELKLEGLPRTKTRKAVPGKALTSVAEAVTTTLSPSLMTCACRKSNPDILVVQPAENCEAKNLPGPFDGTRERRILLQG